MINLNNKKIDWTNFYVMKKRFQVLNEYFRPFSENKMSYNYDLYFFKRELLDDEFIKPMEYYKWAKESLDINGDNMSLRDRIEAISNIKRFIDCKCENFLRELGYTNEINTKNYEFIKKYISSDQAPQISFCSYLLNLNMIIVSEIRSLRNKVEHNYLKPTIKDVIRAISVADLFNLAFNDKINNIIYLCEIMSKDQKNKIEIFLHKGDGNNFDEKFLSNPIITINDLDLRSNDEYYCELLHMLLSHDFKELPKILGIQIPKEHINFKIITSDSEIDAEIYKESNK